MSFGPTYILPTHVRPQFHDAFLAAIQQENSKFAGTTNVMSDWTARQYVLKERDKIEWRVNNARFGKTNATEFTAGNRSGFWQTLEAEPKKFDQWDKERILNIPLPTGPVIEDMMKGLGRIRDDLFIQASTAPALGGPDPYITPQAFPTANILPVNYVKPGQGLGANSGLTVWKLFEIRRRFLALDVDFDREEMILGISPDEETQLLLDAEAAPNDAWAKVVLKWAESYMGGNKESKLMGFKVIQSNRLVTDPTTGIRNCVAYAKRAFVTSAMSDVRTNIDVLPTEQQAIQVTAYALWGTFRAHDELVQQIPCDPTP